MACFLWGTVGAQSLGSCLQWPLLSSVSDEGAGQALSISPWAKFNTVLCPFSPPFCLARSFPFSKLILLLLTKKIKQCSHLLVWRHIFKEDQCHIH